MVQARNSSELFKRVKVVCVVQKKNGAGVRVGGVAQQWETGECECGRRACYARCVGSVRKSVRSA